MWESLDTVCLNKLRKMEKSSKSSCFTSAPSSAKKSFDMAEIDFQKPMFLARVRRDSYEVNMKRVTFLCVEVMLILPFVQTLRWILVINNSIYTKRDALNMNLKPAASTNFLF